ncbi:MAG: hypothetical protein IJU19_05370 [Bacteroidales bacterium]|nr:hypothetical protein [Bacteroidales bacterium]
MRLQLFTRTFTRNEYRAILGKRHSNFVILLLVFLCSVGALEFSRAGLKYLNHKMDDPFINWVDIRKPQPDFERFQADMQRQDLLDRFHIADVECNNYDLDQVFDLNHRKLRVEGRTFAVGSRLVERILAPDNVIVCRQRDITDADYGWIVTWDLLARMGYTSTDTLPLFITLTFEGNSSTIDRWNIAHHANNYIEIPIPILAVVEQLPDLLDYLMPYRYFGQRRCSTNNPLNITNHPSYYSDLQFILRDTVGTARSLRTALDRCGVPYDGDIVFTPYSDAYLPAHRVRIIMRDSVIAHVNAAAEAILSSHNGLTRTYDFDFEHTGRMATDYVSLMFSDISQVAAFADWAKSEYGIRIDMAQIEAKNNFNTFNLLASVLSVAIIILSILFVAIFLWFLIDSHFRAISKNLGTIMAFGLPNATIVQIYLRVFMRLVVESLAMAVVCLVSIELGLSLCGLVRESGFPYISILDGWVLAILVIIPLLTALVVTLTMQHKLEARPGDLIFERIK